MSGEDILRIYREANLGKDEPEEIAVSGLVLKRMVEQSSGLEAAEKLLDVDDNPIEDSSVYVVSKSGIVMMEFEPEEDEEE